MGSRNNPLLAQCPAFDRSGYDPSEEHGLLRTMVAQFTRDKIEPQAEFHDRTGTFNRKLFVECGKLGLLGVTVPAEHGGAGMDSLAAVIVHEEVADNAMQVLGGWGLLPIKVERFLRGTLESHQKNITRDLAGY